MTTFKALIKRARKFAWYYNRAVVLGTLQRDMTPHIVFADLREGDVIGFELPGTLVSVRVVDTALQLVVPCRWHYKSGKMQFRGHAIAAGRHTTFGSSRWAGNYITLAPARRILLNGKPIPEGRLLR